MNVELHIEELVLRGLGGGMQHEIQAAMEREYFASYYLTLRLKLDTWKFK